MIAKVRRVASRLTGALTPTTRVRPEDVPAIRSSTRSDPTVVDSYWSSHTVNDEPFRTARDSERYLEWRFRQYPLFREFMELWGDHDGEMVLDYGCGPGNDVTGFLLYTAARRVIGVDVSEKALALARHRVGLHRVDLDRVELVRTSDASAAIPLPDSAVDFVNSAGVLHHISDPEFALREFRRVLRPGGRANVMVYNRESVFFHLFTAYVRMIVEGAFPGHSLDEAFRRNTDGPECPISRAYPPAEFARLCEQAGFAVDYVGGYMSPWDLSPLDEWGEAAQADSRLDDEHRAFLAELARDERGFPVLRGKHAGVGGVYRLRRS